MGAAVNIYPDTAETLPRSLFGKPSRRSYRAAIKEIILDIKARKSLSDLELADLLGCSKDTIENAQDEACSLDVVTLLNIAYAFGEDAIAPVRSLYLCAPVDLRSETDELADIEGRIRALRIRKEREAD